MDKYTWGFILSVIFDFASMILLLITFCTLKKYRSNPNQDSKYEIFLNENSFPIKPLLSKIYSTSLQEIKENCGEEAHHYLYLTKILAIFISIVCPISVFILLPVYHSGTQNKDEMLKISLGNILDNEAKLAAPFLIFLIIIAGSYYILYIFITETLTSSRVNNINYSFVRIVNLPKDMTENQAKDEISKILEVELSDVYPVPDLSKAMEYEELLKQANDEHLHYLDVEKFKGKREFIKVKYLGMEKADAIEYWESKKNEYKELLEKEYLKSKSCYSGVCIVRVGEKYDIKKLKNKMYEKINYSIVTTMIVADDLNWINIGHDEHTAKAKHVSGTLLFFVIFLIFFTPTAFLNYILDALINIGFSSALVGLLGVYLPDILLLVYQLLLVPKAVEYLVRTESHYSKSGEIISAMRKFILFFLFSMLFLPAIGLSVFSIIQLALQSSFDSFSEDIADRMLESSFWFVPVILTQAFITNPFDLVELGKVIENKYKALRSVSERETYNAYMPFIFEFPLEYSKLITCFAIILAFSIAYPLILIFGSIYLWTRVLST